MPHKNRIVVSVGGSLIHPQEGVSVSFLKKLNSFIRSEIKEDPSLQFFLVVGGGKIARNYRDAGRDVVEHELSADDLDWLGIHATKLNAHLVRTILRDISHPYVIKHYEIIRKVDEPVVVAAGWKPGWSTDFCNTIICEDYKAKTILNLSNISGVFDKDPRVYKDAKQFDHLTWSEFRKIVGDKWTPGMNAPFDPVAARRAQELGLKVVVVKGDDFVNIKKYLEGEKFVGTVIEN